MRIWIVQIGEMISGVDEGVRGYRYTSLARNLAARGHEVVRWSSTFEHVGKKFRRDTSATIEIAPRLQVRLLHALPAYRRNISVARWRQQRHVTGLFLAEAGAWPKPDLIVAGVPVPELAEAAVKQAQVLGIPVVIDAQDQWPDIYLNAAPAPLRPLARLALAGEIRRSRRLFAGATAITAVSQTYLDWATERAGRATGPGDRVFPLGMAASSAGQATPAELALVREKYGISPEAMVALFVGTFGASYDIEAMVACARLLD
ncbi:MAG TPA: glycosyltransferase, partial [Lacunisphaera sp.]|nr:glycosyltransferase [Lacunisphaera sp.]